MAIKSLAAIYNVWDGVELLPCSIKNIANHVDVIIIVYQTTSNYNEEFDPMPGILASIKNYPAKKIILEKYNPKISIGGTANEIEKRNIGIEIAIQQECSHFLHMDCDEFYNNFATLKQLYSTSEINFDIEGSVLELYTYFKKPTLRLHKADNYYVPFIHKLFKNTKAGIDSYSFYVDPTRRINTRKVVLLPGYMHHFSWIRKNIERKVNNSSAKGNSAVHNLLKCYNDPTIGPDYYLDDYKQKLIKVDNIFKINI